jgi:uncharacterized membrane protein
MNQVSFELALLAASVGLLMLYRFLHARRARLDPQISTRAVHDRIRGEWAALMNTGVDKGILAVQTLRNSVMAASFMASTSALAIAGTLGFASEADKLAAAWHRDHAIAFAGALFPLKIFLLLGALFVAFLQFSLSIRLFNHAAYAIVLPNSADAVARYINRAGRMYGDGLRVFYMAFPVVGWLFDATMMLAATAGVLLIRWHLDTADLPRD